MAPVIRKHIATAALAAVAAFWPAFPSRAQTAAPTPQEKKVKDQGEFELYTQAVKGAGGPAKQIADLDAWAQQYPDSDYRDERLYLYVQAYGKLNPPQPEKVIEYGRQLIARGLTAAFPGQGGTLNVLNVLYQVSWNVAGLPKATADQLAAGEKAARELLELVPQYFVPENKPAASTDEDWNTARADLERRGRAALIAIAMAPGKQAMEKDPKECAAAEAVFSKVLQAFPGHAVVSYNLGAALNCIARSEPARAAEVAPRAIYQFVRAAVVDPALGGTADPKKIADYAETAYTQYHGSSDGLAHLKELVKASPLPGEGFTIETAAAVANRKDAEFAARNPQIALWRRLRTQLSDVNGQQYFDGQLKDLAVSGAAGARALKGTIVEGRPACRSRDLLISIDSGQAEITLRLDAPLSGQAMAGQILEFDGVPKAFSREPFMVTMETDRTRIEGLRVEPCRSLR